MTDLDEREAYDRAVRRNTERYLQSQDDPDDEPEPHVAGPLLAALLGITIVQTTDYTRDADGQVTSSRTTTTVSKASD